jgi:hypothetical protein
LAVAGRGQQMTVCLVMNIAGESVFLNYFLFENILK